MNQRVQPLPLPTVDALLSRAELCRVLCMHPRDIPALCRAPFAADPDAVPARVAVGLLVLFWLARQHLDPALAVHVARNAMDADPDQHRFLVAGYQDRLPASAWITSELVDSDAVDAALRARGFAMADKSFVPADLLFFDMLGQVARMRAQDAA